MAKHLSEYMFTGCKDCGKIITHGHPLSSLGKNDFAHKYTDAYITIYYEWATKHYLTIIHSPQERMFMSCANALEHLMQTKEIHRVLEWAGVKEGN